MATDFVTQGVVGAITLNTGSGGTGSFCVNADATADMGVTIKAGQAYVTATPSSQDSQVLRARASSDYTSYAINANSSGSTKYDWIYLKVDATKANDPASDASDVTSIYTSRSSSNTTDNGTPPTYGLLLAVVTIANGATSVTNANIADRRVKSSIKSQENTTGWVSVADTWSYSSWDSTNATGVVTVPSDATATYSPGMRIWISQTTGGTKYGIITKVTSTSLIIYFGTDYTLTNELISPVYFSFQKAPFGFPMEPAKWTVTETYLSDAVKTSPVANTWYGDTALTAAGPNIPVPIGTWDVEWAANLACRIESAGPPVIAGSLSTSSSSESDSNLSAVTALNTISSPGRADVWLSRRGSIAVTTPTTYYLIIKQATGTVNNIRINGSSNGVPALIKAVCAYL